MKTAEIGRVMKIKGLPLERMRDCRTARSIRGLITKARTNGAGSYSNFLIRYPTTPKVAMT